jgi:hypothetical protein
MVEPAFVERVVHQLQHVYETVCANSEALFTVLRFPTLFPIEIRALALRAHGLDQQAAAVFIFQYFHIRLSPDHSVRPLAFCVRRDHVFEDGSIVVGQFFAHRVPVRIVFAGEDGRGPGVTKDFFTVFSRAFCETRRHVFRTSDPETDYCQDPNGLFLHPEATETDCYLLGVLCAKAISMDHLLDIPFNPAFFALMRGETVDIESVDPQLGKSISDFAGCIGHPFIYPGLPDCSLVPDGHLSGYTEVCDDPSHCLFVNLVHDFTCGKGHFALQIRAFRDGFNRVLPLPSLDSFSTPDICRFVCGEMQESPPEALTRNVPHDDGDDRYPQAQWITDLVSDMNPAEEQCLGQFATENSRVWVDQAQPLSATFTISIASSREEGPLSELDAPSADTVEWPED